MRWIRTFFKLFIRPRIDYSLQEAFERARERKRYE